MAGTFFQDQPQDLGVGVQQSSTFPHTRSGKSHVHSAQLIRMCASSYVNAERVGPFYSRHRLLADAARRPWLLKEHPAQRPASSSSNGLHIFSPALASGQRRGVKAAYSRRCASSGQRRSRGDSPLFSPSKFELAGVAALCRADSGASPSAFCIPSADQFRSRSCIPGLKISGASPPMVGRSFATLHTGPRCTIRRSENCHIEGLSEEATSACRGSYKRAHAIPPSATLSPRRLGVDGRGFAYLSTTTHQLDQRDMELNASTLCPPSALPCGSALRQRQGQSPDCASRTNLSALWSTTGKEPAHVSAATKPFGTNVLFFGNDSPCQTRCSGAAASPYEPPFTMKLQPNMLMATAEQAGKGKKNPHQELDEDASAAVVTVYGTDRFWQLMEVLSELQRGPTSLMSSTVTFDSVELPGGELEYAIIEQGSFGRVFVGSHQGKKVAIKVPVENMLRSDAAGVVERTLNEWQILSMCNHPNVVRLVGGVVHGPFDVWLVTQLASGSDLHSRKYSRDPRVQRVITPETGLYMCRQLAAVVAYLHTPIPGRKPVVVHRDIKPENVLIADDWSIQLCDFGDAEASTDGRVSRISGATWFYAPAELLRCSPVERMSSNAGGQLPSFNEKWDIWSMGCVFQEMFGLLNPMHVHISSRDSPTIIYQKLKAKAISGALIPHIAEEIQGIARRIISRCLNPNPEARPSAAEVVAMWNANDDDILKDIFLGRGTYQGAVIGENG